MKFRYLGFIFLVLSGCTSTASYTLRFPDGHKVDVEAVSLPVGLMHQTLVVATRPSDSTVTATVMSDTSAGQTAASILTTGLTVGGASAAIYEGLKQSGNVSAP